MLDLPLASCVYVCVCVCVCTFYPDLPTQLTCTAVPLFSKHTNRFGQGAVLIGLTKQLPQTVFHLLSTSMGGGGGGICKHAEYAQSTNFKFGIHCQG